MGFKDEHPRAVRVHGRLWLALIAAVVLLAAVGTASLAATEGKLDCTAAQVAPAVDASGEAADDGECEEGAESPVLGENAAAPEAPAAGPAAKDAGSGADEGAGAAGDGPPADVPVNPAEGSSDAPTTPADTDTAVDDERAPGTSDDAAPAAQSAPPATPADGAAPPAPAAQSADQAPEQPVTPPAGSAGTVQSDSPAADGDQDAAAVAAAEAKSARDAQRAAEVAEEARELVADEQGTREAGTAEKPSTPAQVYFPPVSVDWISLMPLTPPAFGSGEATRFPGPLFLLPIYQAAAVQYGVPWEVLASINEVETNFGSNVAVSSAGAVGWMQFMPATWEAYGVDANLDGQSNPNDPVDAIFAAARYLHASGATRDLPRAIFAYNHANWYVEKVLRRAKEMGDIPEDLLATLVAEGRTQAGAIRRTTQSPGLIDPDRTAHTIGRVLLLDDERLREHVLADERIDIYGCGREDVRAGVTDRRVLETLVFLAHRKLEPSVTSLRCGHGYYTATGSVSEHSYGSAMDIARVNGLPILGNQGEGSVTDRAIRALLRLRGGLRPHQIISLMSYTGAPTALAMGDHDDHIHVGFAPLRKIEESRSPVVARIRVR